MFGAIIVAVISQMARFGEAVDLACRRVLRRVVQFLGEEFLAEVWMAGWEYADRSFTQYYEAELQLAEADLEEEQCRSAVLQEELLNLAVAYQELKAERQDLEDALLDIKVADWEARQIEGSWDL